MVFYWPTSYCSSSLTSSYDIITQVSPLLPFTLEKPKCLVQPITNLPALAGRLLSALLRICECGEGPAITIYCAGRAAKRLHLSIVWAEGGAIATFYLLRPG